MFQWLKFLSLVSLMAIVHGRDVTCYNVYRNICFNPPTLMFIHCMMCAISIEKILPNDTLSVSGADSTGNITFVNVFTSLPSLPKFFDKTTNTEIREVQLHLINSKVLNAEFLERSCKKITYFEIESRTYKLKVEGLAFQNCTSLLLLGLLSIFGSLFF